MLDELLLREKSNVLAQTLSTGEKRKLCVACSFISDNQIIILDEPSFGLDPITRFDLWHFIRVRKRGRTIFLTTPDLEEADTVGDRIMVMSEGTICCYGTPNFLRKPCGSSYKLTVVKDYKCDVKAVVKVIKHVLPEARYMKQTEIDFTFLVPEIHTFLYPRLLLELESKESSLNVAKVKLVAASIDDVIFCKNHAIFCINLIEETYFHFLPHQHHQRAVHRSAEHQLWTHPGTVDENFNEAACKDKYHQATDFQELENVWLFFQQIKAVLVVQYKFWTTNRRTSIGLLLFPVTLVLMGIILDLQSVPAGDPSPAYFTPDRLGNDLVFPIFYEMNSKTPVREKFVEEVLPQGTVEQYEFSAGLDDSIQNFAESTLTGWAEKKTYRQYTEKVIYSLLSSGKEESAVKLYYRRSFFQADAQGMQLLMNAWVKQVLGENFSIQSGVRLHPRRQMYPFDSFYPFSTGATFYFALAMALLPLPFMYNVVLEKSTGAKHLQMVSGLSPLAYWMGHLVSDVIVYLLLITPVILALLFTDVANIHVVMAIKVLPAFSLFLFPHMYALQFFFQRPATGVYFTLTVNIFFGVLIGMFLDFHLKVNRIDGYHLVVILAETSTPLYSVCVLLGLMLDDYTYRHEVEMYMNEFWSSSIKRLCISWSMVALFEFKVLRVLGYFISMFCEHMFVVMKQPLPEDEEVLTEVSRVESSSYASLFRRNAIVLMKIKKRFFSNLRVFTALHTTSLGIPPNTCLGLLGPSGSGKSTILSILTGRLTVSSGDAYIFGHSLKTELIKSESIESYCPQLDSLQYHLTGREILGYLARLRGIPDKKVGAAVQIIIELLALTGQADQLSESYSVGVKRKISLGSAILGVPKLLYLDEPTLGVEQEVRRNILTVLQYIKSRNGTLVLTSHSVEEMESLCSRIAVLVKGNIVRLGTPQYLMDKYGQGHFVTLYANIEDSSEYIILDTATRFILKSFKHAKVLMGRGGPPRGRGDLVFWGEGETVTWCDGPLGKRPRMESGNSYNRR
ncbi:hypothetical protein Btru_020942 [Bulinus truncatus]|nr:hypothetical protein Btru_020942 [Bulinus truncatus]